jgi:heme exporter protein A
MLTVQKVACERDDRLLFEELSFALQAGEILQIEGQNGSGKTSLLRILCGLALLTTGKLIWRDVDVTVSSSAYLRELLYVGHQAGIKATLTPEENLLWMQAVHPLLFKCTIQTALSQVGLLGFEDVPCYRLSAGQQRRVSLARLYLSEHPLWILDEPFTALDKKGVIEKENLILQHASNGGICILTTHHDFTLTDIAIRRLNLDSLNRV